MLASPKFSFIARVSSHEDGEYIADALQIPNDEKGQYEYWVCTFAVNKLAKTLKKIEKRGGNIISNNPTRSMVTDNSGEAFFYLVEI